MKKEMQWRKYDGQQFELFDGDKRVAWISHMDCNDWAAHVVGRGFNHLTDLYTFQEAKAKVEACFA